MRGENKLNSHVLLVGHGPSPRAWGKQRGRVGDGCGGRTIPTCVGKTRIDAAEGAGSADHPHVRGENRTQRSNVASESGPSPRAWGKQLHRPPIPPRRRTIPTCVGKTRWVSFGWRVISDHPHVRGENVMTGKQTLGNTGPSPRAWGKPGQDAHSTP